MTSALSHPLVSAYLRDLEMLLYGVDPGERAEVLAGVHEHLEASLTPGAADDDVRRSLAELGSPQSVADEAYAGRPPVVAPAVAAPRRSSPWAAVAATAINAVCIVLLFALVTFGAAGAYEVFFSATIFTLPWIAVCVLSAVSGRWDGNEKTASVLVLPAAIVAVTVVLWVLLALIGPQFINLVPTTLIFGAAVWLLVRLARSALR